MIKRALAPLDPPRNRVPLFEDSETCDTVIICHDGEVSAHKALLCNASDYFRARLLSREPQPEIKTDASVQAVRALLEANVYTTGPLNTTEHLPVLGEIYRLAREWLLADVVQAIEREIFIMASSVHCKNRALRLANAVGSVELFIRWGLGKTLHKKTRLECLSSLHRLGGPTDIVFERIVAESWGPSAHRYFELPLALLEAGAWDVPAVASIREQTVLFMRHALPIIEAHGLLPPIDYARELLECLAGSLKEEAFGEDVPPQLGALFSGASRKRGMMDVVRESRTAKELFEMLYRKTNVPFAVRLALAVEALGDTAWPMDHPLNPIEARDAFRGDVLLMHSTAQNLCVAAYLPLENEAPMVMLFIDPENASVSEVKQKSADRALHQRKDGKISVFDTEKSGVVLTIKFAPPGTAVLKINGDALDALMTAPCPSWARNKISFEAMLAFQ